MLTVANQRSGNQRLHEFFHDGGIASRLPSPQPAQPHACMGCGPVGRIAESLGVDMPLFANKGIPMIFPQFVLMTLAFGPVVLVESALIRRPLNLSPLSALKGAAVANLWTTLLGVPLAWLAVLVIGIISTGGYALGLDSPARALAAVTLQAAWLIPYEEHLFWMIPAAATVLLIPCFVISVFIERRVLERRWNTTDRSLVRSAVLRANIWSYMLLLIAGSVWLIFSVR